MAGTGSPGTVVLVGLMGSGKSSVGRRLARRLDAEFVDSDEMLMVTTGRTAAEIRAECGEAHLHDLEARQVLALHGGGRRVVAAAASVVEDARAREVLASLPTVYLRADPGTLAERVTGTAARPLPTRSAGVLEHLREQDRRRRPLYEAVARVVVSTDDRSVDEVVDLVAERLGVG